MKNFGASILLLIFSTSFSLSIQAAPDCNGIHTCTGNAKELVEQIFPFGANGNKQLLVRSPFAVTNLPCTGNNGGSNLVMNDSNLVFEENFALLLAAVLNNNEISIRIDDTQTTCTIRDVRINNLN